MSTPPLGFAPHPRHSPATAAWEPIYSCADGGVYRLGVVIAAQHCNTRGTLHGGVLATLADNACGLTLGLALGAGPKGIFTTSLAIDYVGPGQAGQWLELTPRVVKAGKSSGVVDALITADGEIIARANATFRILG